MRFPLCFLALLGALAGVPGGATAAAVKVGSKAFTENVILGEIATQLIRSTGTDVRYRRELGGTRVLWNALLKGELDIYPEYTGTLIQEILSGRRLRDEQALAAALARHGVGIAGPLGFNNTYVLGMRDQQARQLGIRSISDLIGHPGLRFGFSNEFMDRGDGWPTLRDFYRLPQSNVRGLVHDLAYRAIGAGELDVIDLYSTDAEIRYYRLRPLEDDRGFFPAYRALYLFRMDLQRRAPGVVDVLKRLQGTIDEEKMIAMNAAVKIDGRSETEVASGFLRDSLDLERGVEADGRTARLLRNSRDHLVLVALSLGAAILVAIPLGTAAARSAVAGRLILGAAGIIQTVPALAMLVFMIPLFGIGAGPAVAALFLYSLLPIIRNTYSGLHGIPAAVLESAVAIGLPSLARLRLVELPLAARHILAGVKTAAVINVGTATLGALIGAGGFGQPILTGIRLDDFSLILEGAIPAAALALLVQGFFDLVERLVIPRGLRYQTVD